MADRAAAFQPTVSSSSNFKCPFNITVTSVARFVVTESVIILTQVLAEFFLNHIGFSFPYACQLLSTTFVVFFFTRPERFLLVVLF